MGASTRRRCSAFSITIDTYGSTTRARICAGVRVGEGGRAGLEACASGWSPSRSLLRDPALSDSGCLMLSVRCTASVTRVSLW
eukprot:365655-Chlamydomonas_euryale.AAC.14